MALPTLGVAIQADVERFQAQMDELASTADKAVSTIEQKFAALNPKFDASAFSGGFLGGLLSGAGLGAIERLVKSITDANHELAELDDRALRAGMSLENYQKQQFAADVFGTSNKDFQSGLQSMSDKLNEAGEKETELTKLFAANNVSLKDSNGNLISMDQYLKIAADLVANARSEYDRYKIAEILGANKEMVPYLERGSSAIQQMADKADELGGVIDAGTIAKAKQFDAEWRKSSAEWAVYMKAAAAGILPAIDDLIQRAERFAATVDAAAKNTTDENLQRAGFVTDTQAQENFDAWKNFLAAIAVAIKEGAEGNERFDAALRAFTADAAPAVSAAERLAGAFSIFTNAPAIPPSEVPLPRARPALLAPTNRPAEGGGDDETSALDRQVDALNKHISALEADTAAVGKNKSQVEQLKAELQLLQAVQRDADDDEQEELQKKIDAYAKLRATMDPQQALQKAGIELDADQAQAFTQVTQRAGEAAAALDKMQKSWAAQNSAMQFGGNELINVLDGIRTKSETASAAMANLVNALIKALEQAALLGTGPLAGLLGTAPTAAGGTGGIIGGLASLFKGFFAEGGTVPAGSWGIAGERGPEPVFGGASGLTVVPNLASGAGGGRGGDTSVAIHVNIPSVSGDAAIRATVASGVMAGLSQYDAALPGRLRDINLRGL